eukprot:3364801-Amphidinium_carterae.3
MSRQTCRECMAKKPSLKAASQERTDQKGKGKGKKSGRRPSRGKSAVAEKSAENPLPNQESIQEAIAAQEKVLTTMAEGPARVLIASHIQDLNVKLAAQKPPTLGSQLNSAEARVKKATQRRDKLALILEDTKKQIEANNEELKHASVTLEEVKGLLKGSTQESTIAQPRPASQEPAVADVTAGVCKELAQILTTLQLGMEASAVDKNTADPRERSRSTSRGKSAKTKTIAQKDPSVYGMKAAIQRICALGQQLEALQATAVAVPPVHAGQVANDPQLKAKETPDQHGDSPGTGLKGPSKPGGSEAMEVEPTLAVSGGSPPSSAQPQET